MRNNYQRKERKSNHKFEVVRGQELLVRVPLPIAEVWAELQAQVEELTGQAGLQLRPELNHRYAIPTKDFATIGLPKPNTWNEWGPDLLLLRIPAEHVGTIGAFCSFWGPRRIEMNNREVVEVLVLMGTPAELGRIADAHADLQITDMFLGPETVQQNGGFDFLDYEMDLNFPGVPQIRRRERWRRVARVVILLAGELQNRLGDELSWSGLLGTRHRERTQGHSLSRPSKRRGCHCANPRCRPWLKRANKIS